MLIYLFLLRGGRGGSRPSSVYRNASLRASCGGTKHRIHLCIMDLRNCILWEFYYLFQHHLKVIWPEVIRSRLDVENYAWSLFTF